MHTDPAEPIVIAFDSDCLMCSRTVRWLAARDRRKRLRFTRLSDPIGAEMLARCGDTPPDSMLVRRHDRVHTRSAAAIVILETLGGPWSLLARIIRLVPIHLRDTLYDFIARHRYRWFGKSGTCQIGSDALTRRMLH